MKTLGVVKNVIPAIASTNALISAACVCEALKVATYISNPVDNYFMYMEKDENCLVCSKKPVVVNVNKSMKLKEFISLLKEDKRFKMVDPSIGGERGPIYMPKPVVLEEKHRFKLELSFEELIQHQLYYENENLTVTDQTFSNSLRIIINLV